jgi:NAD(P)-dependent dehydrogenase (short-subunit alcohol dehydrogenase family)
MSPARDAITHGKELPVKILLVGDTGRLGTILKKVLADRGHDVIGASRSDAERPVDIADPASIDGLYVKVGPIDAVACAAGHVRYKSITDIAYADYLDSFTEKALGQIELVRRGLSAVGPRGSFTLITGVLVRTPIVTGSAGATVNGAVEAFVRAAAIEIAPKRINAVSPTVFVEGLDAPGDKFAGFDPVPLREVTQAFVRSIERSETGKVYALD